MIEEMHVNHKVRLIEKEIGEIKSAIRFYANISSKQNKEAFDVIYNTSSDIDDLSKKQDDLNSKVDELARVVIEIYKIVSRFGGNDGDRTDKAN